MEGKRGTRKERKVEPGRESQDRTVVRSKEGDRVDFYSHAGRESSELSEAE